MSALTPSQAASATPTKESPVRSKIIKVARRHFFAHGFRGVTMDDLAKEMGISKKTFYAHFENKQELVKAVMLDKLHEASADLDRLTDRAQDFPAMIHDLLVRVQFH